MSTNNKIKQILTIKQLSPSQLADDIGVQRSSISHILSGRNRPSLDIIQKIVRSYPEFTYDWFMDDDDSQMSITQYPVSTGSTQPTPRVRTPTTANSSSYSTRQQHLQEQETAADTRTTIPKKEAAVRSSQATDIEVPTGGKASTEPRIDRILIFYSNGTFQEYKPG
jgi:transcriptional regulator with XRE-family HTH domain